MEAHASRAASPGDFAVHTLSTKNYRMDHFASTCLTLEAMSLLTVLPPSAEAFSCCRRANESNLFYYKNKKPKIQSIITSCFPVMSNLLDNVLYVIS